MGKVRKSTTSRQNGKGKSQQPLNRKRQGSSKDSPNVRKNKMKAKSETSFSQNKNSTKKFNKISNSSTSTSSNKDSRKEASVSKYHKFSKFANEKQSESKTKKYNWKKGKTKDEDSDIEVVSQEFNTSLNNPLLLEAAGRAEDEDINTRKLVSVQNRKKKQAGGFQSMGLSRNVFNGVIRRGYKVPTPIQRKTIPLIMDGKDVVAMARTGSGKTAAFLIPMFERLITHNAQSGARAVILSPTRELSLQTLKFTKELGKYTQLRAAVILGGDRIDDQFEAMHNNPDIIIATPGRLMHVIVEMEIKLQHVEYVVFDEADRLFEMGFKEQLHEIIHRLPESRQTVLFSATLPKMLVEFARAGLQDPTLIRLDVDSKLSNQLETAFLLCRSEDKPSVLIHLLQNVVSNNQQTVIFAATMHHVDYINMILDRLGLAYSYIYSSMDQTARKISIAKFTNKRCMILVVTDIAARGIDIPMLDIVINYNFPGKSKLFVHRVGRVARAGRTGTAYSIVCPEEMPYLLDLHLFLGRSLNLVPNDDTISDEDVGGFCGRVPQSVVDEGEELMQSWKSYSQDFINTEETAHKAYKQYVKSRALPSSESVKRVKVMDKDGVKIGIHPLFGNCDVAKEDERRNLLDRMKSYKPTTTIFEINSTQKQQARPVMKQKRLKHERVISKARAKLNEKLEKEKLNSIPGMDKAVSSVMIDQGDSGRKRPVIKDSENYINYQPSDFRTEMGLSTRSFETEASREELDLTADSTSDMRQQQKTARWDRQRKRFVQSGGNVGKNKRVKTEGGTWIKASYKSNLYKDWLKRSKITEQELRRGESDSDNEHVPVIQQPSNLQTSKGLHVLGTTKQRWQNKAKKEFLLKAGLQSTKTRGGKLKTTEQILKERKRKDKIVKFQKTRKRLHDRNRGRKK